MMSVKDVYDEHSVLSDKYPDMINKNILQARF